MKIPVRLTGQAMVAPEPIGTFDLQDHVSRQYSFKQSGPNGGWAVMMNGYQVTCGMSKAQLNIDLGERIKVDCVNILKCVGALNAFGFTINLSQAIRR